MAHEGKPPEQGVGVRGIVLGLLFVVLLCWAVPWVDIYFGASELAGSHFPIGPFLILFLLAAGVNALLPKLSARLRLNSAELTAVYCMVLAAAGIPTYGLVAYLLPGLTAPFYYSTSENNWARLVGEQIPAGLRPTDLQAIRMLYEGSKGASIPWSAWIGPLAHWTVFVVALFGLMFCLTAIIRKQWIEKERLTFPLVDLQLEMIQTDSGGRHTLFGNRVFWVGAAGAFAVHGINALQAYFPAMPGFPLKSLLTFPGDGWPLNDRLSIYFSVIGFGYLLTTEVSFSVWFFFWLHKLQHFAAAKLGAYEVYVEVRESQYIGAFIVFVLFALWKARRHLFDVLRKAATSEAAVDDSQEPLSYRCAVLGVVASLGVLAVWCVWSGVSLPVFFTVFFIFILVCFGLTRIVIETGVFSAKVTQMVPLKLMVPAVGTAALGPANLTMVSVIQFVFMFDLKTFLMPALMHGQRMAGRTGTSNRRLFGAVALAVLVAIVVSYWSNLYVAYKVGGANLSRWFYQSGPIGSICAPVASWTNHPEPMHWGKVASGGAGAVFTALLIFLRQRLLYWPLHPIGYIIAFSFETTRVWFSFMVGWLVKVVVLRYGGGSLFRRVRYLFLGFILGELGAAGFWIIIDLLAGLHGHIVFP